MINWADMETAHEFSRAMMVVIKIDDDSELDFHLMKWKYERLQAKKVDQSISEIDEMVSFQELMSAFYI